MNKLPKKAKRVFKGVIFDLYQWQQQMFNGKSETFECISRPDTVQVIVVQNNKILIAKQRQPHKRKYFYSFFGGRVDPKDKTPLAAAKRELLEESGLVSSDWQWYKSFSPHSKIRWEVHYFIARDCRVKTKQNLDVGEKIEVVVVDFNKLSNLIINNDIHAGELLLDIGEIKVSKKHAAELKKKLFK